MRFPIRLFLLGAALARVAAAQAAPDTMKILHAVEQRYNSIKTLQANFTLTFKDRGRSKVPERGVLYLNKKNHQTRWENTSPPGNYFLTNDKFTWDYDKQKNIVERTPLKQTEDMRIPLSFLLGDLNFEKDFGTFGLSREGENGDNFVIKATPRNSNLWFKDITMLIAPDSSIRRVTVLAQEGSTMDYVLEGEKRDPVLSDALFRFVLPPGAQLVEASN